MRSVAVDEGACARVASKLSGLRVRKPEPIGLAGELNRETALRVLFFFSAINHDTRGLRGVIRGRLVRGSEYLLHLLFDMARQDPSALEPARLAELTLSDFLSWFGEPGEAVYPRRPAERVELLRDAARKLLAHYNGRVEALLEACGGRLSGPGGLVERLRAFRAFSDPLAKKTMVFAILASLEGLWEPLDREAIKVGVDYHLQRVALRTGMVRPLDERLREKLARRLFVSAEEHHAIRAACLKAYERVGELSGLSQLEVDQVFWHLGRSCCTRLRPACELGGACERRAPACSLREALSPACGGRCLLSGACEGERKAELRKLAEPKVITFYY